MHCSLVWKISVSLIVIYHIIEGVRAERTKFNWDNYGMNELSKDIELALNRSVGDLLQQVVIRFPQIIDVIKDVLNATSNGNGINHTELCEKIKLSLETKQDACNYPEHIISRNKTLGRICDATNYNISFLERHGSSLCRTRKLLFRSFEKNETNITLPGSVLPTNAFFMAVKVLAGTAVAANKRKCLDLGGTFDESSVSCFKNGTKVDLKSEADETLRVVSVIGNSISLCSLIFMIATYFKFRKHETLAGKCIICLSFALVFVHAIQIVLSYAFGVSWMCRLGATLLHYSLLLAFSWMAVIAFDFYYTFSKVRPVDQHARRKRFRIYFGSTFSIATMILFICLMIDIPDERHAGYGLNGTCFLARFWANLFAFIVPVCIVLLFNGIFLTLTIVSLRSFKKSTAKSLSSSSSSASKKKEMVLSVMALKLSVLLGFGWISGFVEGSIGSKALRYIYTIVIALQGLFVLIAFGCHIECKKATIKAKNDRETLTKTASVPLGTL